MAYINFLLILALKGPRLGREEVSNVLVKYIVHILVITKITPLI